MATAIKLRSDIKKYEAAIKSKATPSKFKEKLKAQLDKAKSDLVALKSPKSSKSAPTKKKKVISNLEKLKAKVKKTPSLARYKNSGVDLEKDADQPALRTGRRVSQGIKGNQYADKKSSKGNVYYEYRVNRLDIKQPPKRYPKLEDGGMMAKGGDISNFNYELKIQHDYPYKNIANRWLEDNSKDSLKYQLAVLLLREKKDPDEILGVKDDAQYGRLLRSLEKAKGESKHEMAWRTNNYSLGEAEKWARESLRDIFYVHVDTTKMANGGYMAYGGETEDGVDLFEDYDEIPPNVQSILDKHSEAFEDGDYRKLEKALNELKKIGYTFEYELDGQAYDLRKIGQKGKSEEYADGGMTDWQTAKIGDSALVISENKLGLIIKDYGRKFHMKFPDGREKTYDASELKFMKFDDEFADGGYMAKGGSVDPMATVNEIARLSGLRPIAVAEWGDKNNINLVIVLKDLKYKKIKGVDLMTAIVGNPNNKYSKELLSKYSKMAMGGVTFKKKVKSIKSSLLKRKKVSPKVQKDYGKTYSPKEAEESAKRIVGAMTARERMKMKMGKK